jgi:O-antigen ligase
MGRVRSAHEPFPSDRVEVGGVYDRAAAGFAALGFLSLITNRLPVLTVAAWGAAAVTAGIARLRRPPPRPRLEVGVGLVWAYWIASYALTGESWSHFFSYEFHRRDGQIFFSLLPLLVLSWVRIEARQASRVFSAFCAAQGLIVAAALPVFLRDGGRDLYGVLFVDSNTPEHLPFFVGLYRAHNAAGSVLALCTLAAVALALFAPTPRAWWGWALLAVPLQMGVLLSKSRGSILALGVGLACLVGAAIRRRRLTGKAVALAVLVLFMDAALLGPMLVRRFAEFAIPGDTHTLRLQQWKRAAAEWTASPFVGQGMGRFNDEEREGSGRKPFYWVVTRARVVHSDAHAHNSYAHFLSEGGIVGCALTVGFWVWVAWRLGPIGGAAPKAARAAVAFLLTISFTEHYMGGGAMLLVLSSLVGAAWSLRSSPWTSGAPWGAPGRFGGCWSDATACTAPRGGSRFGDVRPAG